jgi:hypothetical protein
MAMKKAASTKKATAAKKGAPTKRKSPAPGSKGAKKIEKVMHEHKTGKLKSSSGQKVTNRKQAVAIALSEAREAGARIPKKPAKKSASSKKK